MRIITTSIIIISILNHTTISAQKQEREQFIKDSLHFYSLKDSIYMYWYQSSEKVSKFSEQMMELAKDNSYKPWIAESLNNIGHVFQDKDGESNLKKSIKKFEKAIVLYTELNNLRGLSNSYNNMAISYKKLGHFPKALNYSLKSLEVLKSIKDTSSNFYVQLGVSYSTLANRYADLSLYHKAIKIHDSALFHFKNTNYSVGIYSTYINQSDIYKKQKIYDKALMLSLEAYEGFNNSKIKRGQVLSLISLAELYTVIHQIQQATQYSKKGLEYTKGEDFLKDRIYFYRLIAENFIKLKRLDSASFYLKPAIKLADSLGILDVRINTLELKAQIIEKQGDTISALSYYREASLLRDSLEQRQNIQKANTIVLKEEEERNHEKIENLEKVVNKKNNWLYSIIAILLLLIVLGYVLLRKYKRGWITFKKKQHQLEDTVQTQKEEKDYLQRKLVSNTASLAIKDKLLEKTTILLETIKTSTQLNDLSKDVHVTQTHIKDNLELNKVWEEFFLHFEQVHPDFIERLKDNYDLTANDLKICAFIKMNLTQKEIARIFNVNHNSIHVSLFRLRKKFKLEKGMSASEFIQSKMF